MRGGTLMVTAWFILLLSTATSNPQDTTSENQKQPEPQQTAEKPTQNSTTDTKPSSNLTAVQQSVVNESKPSRGDHGEDTVNDTATVKNTSNTDSSTDKIKPNLSLEERSVCHQCTCPRDKMENPYVIDCRSLDLSAVPPWDPKLNQVDNVHLDLSSNLYTMVPPFETNVFIDALIFNNNEIDMVTSNAFSHLPHLKTLSLYGNRIVDLHKSSFCGVNDSNSPLEVLNLSNNTLMKLDDDVFQCTPELQHLILANNHLMSIDQSTQTALNSLKNLQLLDLSGNGLGNIPNGLINPIVYLDTLVLARNQFNYVPDVLEHASHLVHLDLDHNPMTQLNMADFIGLTSLTTLNISNMTSLVNITAGTFQPLLELKYLHCNYNSKLRLIEPFAFGNQSHPGPKYIETVELRHNNLSHLREEVVAGTHVHLLDISGNPFHCSCDLFWIVVHANTSITPEVYQQTTCVAPPQFEGVPLNLVPFQGAELHCPDILPTGTPPPMSPSYTFLLALVIILTSITLAAVGYTVWNQWRKTKYHTLERANSSGGVKYDGNKFNDAFDSAKCEEMEEY